MSAPFLYGTDHWQMDDLAKYNKERWEALAKANITFLRPFLELDKASARQVVDPERIMGWEHFKSIAPPWLTFWAMYRPNVFK